MKDMICIVCPVGCRISVDEENDYKVIGLSLIHICLMEKQILNLCLVQKMWK